MIGHSHQIESGCKMNGKYVAAILAATLPTLALGQGADSYQCSYGELQRRVEILRETGVDVPCEVHYHKDTEAPGEPQVLWRATSEAGYCEKKTEEFIAKLRDWGWNCGNADQPEALPEKADDTEALTTEEEPNSGESE